MGRFVSTGRLQLPGCRIPSAGGDCLPECRAAGACRASSLLLVDGRVMEGRPQGVVGETLRFQSVYPVRGPLLLPFSEVEPLSLHEALVACTDPADGEAVLRLAEVTAARGLVDLALRELDRALEAAPEREVAVRELRKRLVAEAARRVLQDARDYLEAHRVDHARAALDEVLHRFPGTESAREARKLRRTLVGGAA